MSRRTPRWMTRTAALAAAVALLSSCGGGASLRAPRTTTTSTAPPATTTTTTTQPSSQTPPAPSNGPYWLVQDFTLALLERNGLPAATITKLFNSPRTLLIVRPHGDVPDALVPLATKVETFASFTRLQAAIQGSAVEPGVRYVLYDNEAWSFTPANEKAAPFTYAAQALALAHAHGLQLIFTPAANLTPLLSTGYSASNQLASATSKFSGYLHLNMAGQGAAASDIVEIQGQQAEVEPGFTSFVSQAVAQARAAAPSHPVLLGITTSIPGSGAVSAADLTGVVAADQIPGRWLLAEHPGGISPVSELRPGRCRPGGVVARNLGQRPGRLNHRLGVDGASERRRGSGSRVAAPLVNHSQ